MKKTLRKQLGIDSSGPQSTDRGTESEAPMVTKAEQVRLLQALSRGMRERGLKGVTEAEAHAVWTWAHQTRVANAILDLALLGLVTISIREDGQVTFKGAVDLVRAEQILIGRANRGEITPLAPADHRHSS